MPSTRLRCAMGHSWEPAGASPLVCPTCGRPPVSAPMAANDPDRTIDQDMDRTVDMPAASQEAMAIDSMVSPMEHSLPAPTRGGVTSTGEFQKASVAMPFTIIRQHARGGLGVVNLARDEHIRREVALKQMLPHHGDDAKLQKRFLYEAQITGQLEHPSIVPVYSLGRDDTGKPFYVMRFVKGRTLDTIIIEHHAMPNPIVFRELLRRFIAVCQAVAYAHSRGVIHRDLKPSNIMLGDYGETLVLDWGLAKDVKSKSESALEPGNIPASVISSKAADMGDTSGAKSVSLPSQMSSTEVTTVGQIIGTPAYMAPEQADGRTDLHQPVTDIYALGGILYKILTGKSPEAPKSSMVGEDGMRRLAFVESPPPSTVNKDCDPLLERICMHAMAKEPGARYPRALELAQDIQRWLDEHPLTFKRETKTGRVIRAMQKIGPFAIFFLLGIIAILMIIIVMKSR